MRRIIPEPVLFKSAHLSHELARELEAIDRVLDANPLVAEAVWKDLEGPRSREGRQDLSVDQVLRAAIVKRLKGYNYEELAFYLADSATNRRFCGFSDPEDVPGKSSLARRIRNISAETWEEIDRIVMIFAVGKGKKR